MSKPEWVVDFGRRSLSRPSTQRKFEVCNLTDECITIVDAHVRSSEEIKLVNTPSFPALLPPSEAAVFTVAFTPLVPGKYAGVIEVLATTPHRTEEFILQKIVLQGSLSSDDAPSSSNRIRARPAPLTPWLSSSSRGAPPRSSLSSAAAAHTPLISSGMSAMTPIGGAPPPPTPMTPSVELEGRLHEVVERLSKMEKLHSYLMNVLQIGDDGAGDDAENRQEDAGKDVFARLEEEDAERQRVMESLSEKDRDLLRSMMSTPQRTPFDVDFMAQARDTHSPSLDRLANDLLTASPAPQTPSRQPTTATAMWSLRTPLVQTPSRTPAYRFE